MGRGRNQTLRMDNAFFPFLGPGLAEFPDLFLGIGQILDNKHTK